MRGRVVVSYMYSCIGILFYLVRYCIKLAKYTLEVIIVEQ